MKWVTFILFFCALTLTALGQDETVNLDELMQSAERWAKENLDEDALRVLQNVDREQVNQFFASVQKQFHGQYLVDLAPLKNAAKSVVPLLEGYEETLPYAIWLKTRLDYFDVADQFRLIIP